MGPQGPDPGAEKSFGGSMPSGASAALPPVGVGFRGPVGEIAEAICRHGLHRRHTPGLGQCAQRSLATERTFQDLAGDMPARVMLFSGDAETLAGAIQRNFHGSQDSPVEAFRDDHAPLLELVRSAPIAPRSHAFRGLARPGKNRLRKSAACPGMPACVLASARPGPGFHLRAWSGSSWVTVWALETDARV